MLNYYRLRGCFASFLYYSEMSAANSLLLRAYLLAGFASSFYLQRRAIKEQLLGETLSGRINT
jgi:hypothetical protein